MYSMLMPRPSSAPARRPALRDDRPLRRRAPPSLSRRIRPLRESRRPSASRRRSCAQCRICWVSASNRARMSTPFSASRRMGRRCVPACFRQTTKSVDLHDVRLSMTRLALPSLRSIECASTSVTCTRIPARDRARPAASMQLLQRPDLVVEHLRGHLDLHFHLVQALLAREEDLVMRQGAFHLQQRRFNLRRKDVDAANDQHVVAAAAMRPIRRIVRPHSQRPGRIAVMSRVR